jgi:hypothetical protein
VWASWEHLSLQTGFPTPHLLSTIFPQVSTPAFAIFRRHGFANIFAEDSTPFTPVFLPEFPHLFPSIFFARVSAPAFVNFFLSGFPYLLSPIFCQDFHTCFPQYVSRVRTAISVIFLNPAFPHLSTNIFAPVFATLVVRIPHLFLPINVPAAFNRGKRFLTLIGD